MHVTRLIFALGALFAPLSIAAAAVSTGVDSLQIITRQSSVGTNLPRAETETRSLDSQAVTERIRRALDKVECPSARNASVRVEPLTMRDFIGNSTARTHGMGLYVSNLPATERGMVQGYIAPYLSVTVQLKGSGDRTENFEIWEFERLPINQSTNLDFVKNNPAAIESAILSFSEKTLEMHLRRHAAVLCGAA